jgi:hypothetical protein
MKLQFGLLMLAFLVMVGCRTTQPEVTPEALVGSYAYVSQDPESRATDHNLNHLVLRSNREYDLVKGGKTKAMSEEKGVWTITPGNPPNLLLKNEVLPIEIKKDEVRLLIDLDVGIWWAKGK